MVNRHRRRASEPVSGTSRHFEDVASDQIRRRVQVGVLILAAHAFVGHEPLRPDPFVGRRDEKAITKRMAEIRRQANDLLKEGWEVYTVKPERRADHPHERVAWRARPMRGRSSQWSWTTPGSTTPRP